jgi:hypothetical protein
VWKAVVRFRGRHPEFLVVTLDVDWGCTVIRRRAISQPTFRHPVELTWELLSRERGRLLNVRPATWVELAQICGMCSLAAGCDEDSSSAKIPNGCRCQSLSPIRQADHP